MPHDRDCDRGQRKALLMREPEESLGSAVGAEGIEHDTERTVERQVESKSGAAPE